LLSCELERWGYRRIYYEPDILETLPKGETEKQPLQDATLPVEAPQETKTEITIYIKRNADNTPPFVCMGPYARD
jgi:hypothetical protein